MTHVASPRLALLPVALVALLAACSQSHVPPGGGPACGPTTCATGQVCCNESCGICTAPGEGCIDLFCEPVDGGGPITCGGAVCPAGATCCAGCEGDPAFCSGPGGICPDLDCPPPTECRPGERLCEGCPGEPGFCVGEREPCPARPCPPPPECAPGERLCPACPGQPPFCVDDGVACPLLRCPPEECRPGERLCDACPGEPPFCVDADVPCPVFRCPPPGECGPGEQVCTGCPGDPDFCVPDDVMCPVFDCPPPPSCDGEPCESGRCCPGCPGEGSFCIDDPSAPCPDLSCPPILRCTTNAECGTGTFCRKESCGDVGFCDRRPEACPEDCPGVCGCDGRTYCNECIAAAFGQTVAREGACDTPPPPTSCSGREFCDCSGACEPLIDLTTGCVCPCDDPFNCTGETCACACGGARYLGCAPAGRCDTTRIRCPAECGAFLDPEGCPVCACTPDADAGAGGTPGSGG